DSRQASQLAQKLGHINAERQDMTRQFVEQARSRILEDRELAPLYLIADPRFNEGVVGLVASRLTDEFYRPTLVARRGTRITKGSGRSIPEFDITRALDQCADLLVRYGGHAAAAGFTIETDNLPRLQARLTEIAHRALDDQPLQKTMLVDAEINLRGVTPQLVTEVHNLAPFGYNNPTPKFLTRGLVVQYCRPVGRDGSHLKMKLSDGKRLWDAIGFRMAAQWGGLAQGARVDAVYNLEFNTWNGRTAMQLNLKDLRLSEAS
ncbi:MAG: single-stranded-DNA-specific exonuclease RecJ, partial [Caldilineae bacterium]